MDEKRKFNNLFRSLHIRFATGDKIQATMYRNNVEGGRVYNLTDASRSRIEELANSNSFQVYHYVFSREVWFAIHGRKPYN